MSADGRPVTGTRGPAAPGQAAHVAGMPRTAPRSVADLPGYWRDRAAEAQRGAVVRSVDYQRGTVFRRCAGDLEDALVAQAAQPQPVHRWSPHDLADQAIGMFLEYRDQHGHDEPSARAAAALEVAEGAAVTDDEIAAQPQPAPELTRVFQGQAPAPEGVTTSASGMQPAPELAAAMAETREVRDGYARLCEEFSDSPQSGQSARISLTVLNRHRKAAGLNPLRPAPAGERRDPYMQAIEERDRLRVMFGTLTDRAEASGAITEDEADEYRKDAERAPEGKS